MTALYAVHRGDFHVTGVQGKRASDHLNHLLAMGETMFSLLAARWEARQSEEPDLVPNP